jgi:hypothetical protein
LDELDVDSARASVLLILKSFKKIPLQLSSRGPACVLACLLTDDRISTLRGFGVEPWYKMGYLPTGAGRTFQLPTQRPAFVDYVPTTTRE